MQKLAETDAEGIDYAAAGVKDLSNFKGYHNNNEAKQDAINQQHDQETGAHFKYPVMC